MIHHVLTCPAYAGLFVYGATGAAGAAGRSAAAAPPPAAARGVGDCRARCVPALRQPDAILRERGDFASQPVQLRQEAASCAARRAGLIGRAGGVRALGTTDHGELRRRASRVPVPARADELPRAWLPIHPISYVDLAVRDAFFAAIQPSRLQVLLGALDALERQSQALDRQWQLKLERARYAARLAERQSDACDPDNRLVAGAWRNAGLLNAGMRLWPPFRRWSKRTPPPATPTWHH